MCDLNTLQQKIADLTNDGEIVIRFLAETVQGKTPGVQPCHRLEATRQLTRFNNLGNSAPSPSTEDAINIPSPSTGEGQDGGENTENPAHPVHPVTSEKEEKNTYDYTNSDPDPDQDCYYEPLTPEAQSLFDYHTLIESGEYQEGEIHPRPVTETQRLGYQAMLKWIRESAQAEGVPVLPNPLSGTFKRPKARSP